MFLTAATGSDRSRDGNSRRARPVHLGARPAPTLRLEPRDPSQCAAQAPWRRGLSRSVLPVPCSPRDRRRAEPGNGRGDWRARTVENPRRAGSRGIQRLGKTREEGQRAARPPKFRDRRSQCRLQTGDPEQAAARFQPAGHREERPSGWRCKAGNRGTVEDDVVFSAIDLPHELFREFRHTHTFDTTRQGKHEKLSGSGRREERHGGSGISYSTGLISRIRFLPSTCSWLD